MTAILQARELSIKYDGRTAAQRVSFDLEPGTVLGLIGESGSGKTSVAMAMLGLLPPNAEVDGTVMFEGKDIAHLGERELRQMRGRSLAAIIQNASTSLDPCYTIGNQFAELLRAHGRQTRRAVRTSSLQWLERVGLRDPAACLRSYPHELSGGMNQRVMIAMALALGPSVLVADEPTSALDVTVQARILRLLKSLLRSSVGAAVVITHDLGVVRFLATDVAVMRNGEIVEQGPVDQVFGEPRHDYTRHLFASIPGGRSFRTRGPGQPVVAAEAQS